MENYGLIPEILLLVALLSSGAVLFLVGRKVIEQMDIFRGRPKKEKTANKKSKKVTKPVVSTS